MSRRDGAIVAWHEVPGTAATPKCRPVGNGVIRAGVCAHRFDDWSDEISNTKAFLKKHGAHFDEKHLWD